MIRLALLFLCGTASIASFADSINIVNPNGLNIKIQDASLLEYMTFYNGTEVKNALNFGPNSREILIRANDLNGDGEIFNKRILTSAAYGGSCNYRFKINKKKQGGWSWSLITNNTQCTQSQNNLKGSISIVNRAWANVHYSCDGGGFLMLNQSYTCFDDSTTLTADVNQYIGTYYADDTACNSTVTLTGIVSGVTGEITNDCGKILSPEITVEPSLTIDSNGFNSATAKVNKVGREVGVLTYDWKSTDGLLTLSNNDNKTVKISAPVVDVDTQTSLTLTVWSSSGASITKKIAVTIKKQDNNSN